MFFGKCCELPKPHSIITERPVDQNERHTRSAILIGHGISIDLNPFHIGRDRPLRRKIRHQECSSLSVIARNSPSRTRKPAHLASAARLTLRTFCTRKSGSSRMYSPSNSSFKMAFRITLTSDLSISPNETLRLQSLRHQFRRCSTPINLASSMPVTVSSSGLLEGSPVLAICAPAIHHYSKFDNVVLAVFLETMLIVLLKLILKIKAIVPHSDVHTKLSRF